jgi:ribosomal protein S19E (S16A)
MKFTPEHEQVLVKTAKWIKAHRELYCPTTAVKGIPKYRKLLDELHSMGLVERYKKGEVVKISRLGWYYLNETHPELTCRGRILKI